MEQLQARSRTWSPFRLPLGRWSHKNVASSGSSHFTTSIQQVKLFYQTFSKTAQPSPEKPLHQRSRSQSCFWRSRSPAKQALSPLVVRIPLHPMQLRSQGESGMCEKAIAPQSRGSESPRLPHWRLPEYGRHREGGASGCNEIYGASFRIFGGQHSEGGGHRPATWFTITAVFA